MEFIPLVQGADRARRKTAAVDERVGPQTLRAVDDELPVCGASKNSTSGDHTVTPHPVPNRLGMGWFE